MLFYNVSIMGLTRFCKTTVFLNEWIVDLLANEQSEMSIDGRKSGADRRIFTVLHSLRSLLNVCLHRGPLKSTRHAGCSYI